MSVIVAAAGGGNWTAGATWVGGVAPTAADDVQLSSASGNVTIDTGAVCRSLDCNTYTGTLTHSTGVTLAIGDATPGAGAIALRLVAGMTYSLGNSATSAILFCSTSTVAQSIDTGSKTLGNTTYNASSNGSWVFTSTNTANIVTLTAGSLDTGSQACAWLYFVSTGSSTRSLTFGSSSITLSGADGGGTSWNVNSAGITASLLSSTITLGGKITPGVTLGTIVLTAGLTTNTGMTCTNLTRVGAASKTDTMSVNLNGSLVVTGTVTFTGNSAINRLLIQSSTVGTARTIAAANVSLTNVDFMDISGSGSATWSGTSLGDCGGNTGIQFDTPTTQTWNGTSGGNWSTNAWTSRVPLPQDNVVINAAFAASQTVTADMPRLGANVNWTGVSGSPAFTIGINCSIYGSFTLTSGISGNITGVFTVTLAGRGNFTFTPVGKLFNSSISISAPGGTYVLNSNVTNTSQFSVINGAFNDGGFAVQTTNFVANTSNTKSITVSGQWTITTNTPSSGWNINSSGTTFSGASSVIIFNTGTASRTFAGGGFTYGTLTYTVAGSTGSLTITGANTFSTINFSDASNARTLILPASATTTITSAFNVQGTSGKLMTVSSSSAGTAATLSKQFGIVSCDYLSIQDSTATGGAAWYAGANSTNVSGNTGWTFTVPATVVAAAGGGNWSSTSTWVGGVVPTSSSNVQFTSSSGNVTIDTASVCRSLHMTGYTGTLTHTAAITLTIGDGTAGLGNTALALNSGMSYTLGNANTSAITFASTSTTQQAIGTASKSLGSWTINGTGSSYTLTDSNTTGATATATLAAGALSTANQPCSWGSFAFGGSLTRTLTLGSSAITITGTASNGFWCSGTTGLTITANTAVVTLTAASGLVNLAGANMNGTSVVFTTANSQLLNGATLKNITFTGPISKTSQLLLSSNITATGTLSVNGNSAVNRIIILSNTAGTARTITAAVVSVTNVDFMDITGAGAGSWNLAGIAGGAGDCGGNTGITFTTPVSQTHTSSAGGNWSDITKWTSRVPLPQDNVTIDANTSGTITADMPRLGADINFTGFTGTAAFNSTANSGYGSWTNGSGMTISGTQTLTLSARTNKVFTSNGCTFTQALTFTAPGATYTLSDALNTNGQLGIINGTAGNSVNLNSMAVTCKNINVNGLGANLTCGSSTVTLTTTTLNDYVVLRTNNATLSGDTATFIIANATSNSRNFSTANGMSTATLTYTVAGSTGPLVFINTNNVGTLNFSDASNARTLTFPSGQTTTITNFNVSGSTGKLVTINASTAASTATLSKPTGIVSCDYLALQDSAATGGASWYAGANSTNISNNSGWIFGTPPNTTSSFLEFFD